MHFTHFCHFLASFWSLIWFFISFEGSSKFQAKFFPIQSTFDLCLRLVHWKRIHRITGPQYDEENEDAVQKHRREKNECVCVLEREKKTFLYGWKSIWTWVSLTMMMRPFRIPIFTFIWIGFKDFFSKLSSWYKIVILYKEILNIKTQNRIRNHKKYPKLVLICMYSLFISLLTPYTDSTW